MTEREERAHKEWEDQALARVLDGVAASPEQEELLRSALGAGFGEGFRVGHREGGMLSRWADERRMAALGHAVAVGGSNGWWADDVLLHAKRFEKFLSGAESGE